MYTHAHDHNSFQYTYRIYLVTLQHVSLSKWWTQNFSFPLTFPQAYLSIRSRCQLILSLHPIDVYDRTASEGFRSRIIIIFDYSIYYSWGCGAVRAACSFARVFLRHLQIYIDIYTLRINFRTIGASGETSSKFQSWNMLRDLRRISWVRVIVADVLSLGTSSRERPTSTLSLRRPYLVLYMSPKIPAKVFRRFFIVSSLSSPCVCDWLPCRWNGTLDVGGSSERRPADGALLTVLDWEAARIENIIQLIRLVWIFIYITEQRIAQ